MKRAFNRKSEILREAIPRILLSKWQGYLGLAPTIPLALLLTVFQSRVGQCTISQTPEEEWESVFFYLVTGANAYGTMYYGNQVLSSWLKADSSRNMTSAFAVSFLLTFSSLVVNLVSVNEIFDSLFCGSAVSRIDLQLIGLQIALIFTYFTCIGLDVNKEPSFNDGLTLVAFLIVSVGTVFSIGRDSSNPTGLLTGVNSYLRMASLVIFCALAAVVGWQMTEAAMEEHKSTSKSMDDPKKYINTSIATRRVSASILYNLLTGFFGLSVFCQSTAIISSGFLLVGVSLISVLSIGAFSNMLTEEHMELMDPVAFQLVAENKTNITKRAFIRYIFHELRSPLNSVIMGLYCLMEGNKMTSPEDIDMVVLMKEATTYMSDTLNDVLNMQNIEEGLMSLEFSDMNIQYVVSNVVAQYTDLLRSKRIYLEARIQPGVPLKMRGDTQRLELVLANLISNAIKFCKSGAHVRVKVETTTSNTSSMSRGNHRFMRVAVIDDGVGVHSKNVEDLFTPYVQLRTGEFKQRGSGVGLAVCKEIVAAHGGEIGYLSAESNTPDCVDKKAPYAASSSSSAAHAANAEEVMVSIDSSSSNAASTRISRNVSFSALEASSADCNGSEFFFTIPIYDDDLDMTDLLKEQFTISIAPDEVTPEEQLPPSNPVTNRNSFRSKIREWHHKSPRSGKDATGVIPSGSSEDHKDLLPQFSSKSLREKLILTASALGQENFDIKEISSNLIEKTRAMMEFEWHIASNGGTSDDAGDRSAAGEDSQRDTRHEAVQSLLEDGRHMRIGMSLSQSTASNSMSNSSVQGSLKSNTTMPANITAKVPQIVAPAVAPVPAPLQKVAPSRQPPDEDDMFVAFAPPLHTGSLVPPESTNSSRKPSRSSSPRESARQRKMPALELKDLPRQLPPAPRRQHTTDEVDYSHMKYRFLLVDDVFSNRKILHMLLKKRGVECEMAEDGVQCLQMVEARGDTYSLIFMDNMMPKMGGVQTTKRLREMGFERMIIGLTGNTLLDEIIEFEESGVDVVFPKPVNLRQIDTLLKFMQSNGLQTTINDRSAVKPDGTRERNIMSSYFPSNSARTR